MRTQEAINLLVDFMYAYPQCYKIEVIEKNQIKLHYSIGRTFLTEEFESAQDMLDWADENLKRKD